MAKGEGLPLFATGTGCDHWAVTTPLKVRVKTKKRVNPVQIFAFIVSLLIALILTMNAAFATFCGLIRGSIVMRLAAGVDFEPR